MAVAVVVIWSAVGPKPLARKFESIAKAMWVRIASRGMEIVRPTASQRQVYIYAMGLEPWLTYLTSIQYTDESRPIIRVQ